MGIIVVVGHFNNTQIESSLVFQVLAIVIIKPQYN